MTDMLIGLVAMHGAWLVALITYASCLAVPVPASLAMMAAGAFVAVGDLSGPMVAAAALGGAVAGDQTGYAVGRRSQVLMLRLARLGGNGGSFGFGIGLGGTGLRGSGLGQGAGAQRDIACNVVGPVPAARSLRGGRIRRQVGAARGYLARRGGWAVFLSRWLFSPLGPYVNFAAGASGLDWRRFSLASLMGESLWVVLYVGLGWAFGTQIDVAADLAGSILAGAGAVVVALISGRALWRRHRRVRRQIPAV